jgi:hypothetical protein
MVTYWVHDLETLRAKAIVVGGLYVVDVLALVVFAGLLGWI